MEKECQICGVFFDTDKSIQKYCPECGKDTRRAKKDLDYHMRESLYRCGTGRTKQAQNNTCNQCHKIFITYEWNPGEFTRDFCSKKCREEYHIAHTFCRQCEKPMLETDDQRDMYGKNWFCSDSCREEFEWEIARKNGMIKNCPVCGKEFIKKTTYCSRACYLIAPKKVKPPEMKIEICAVCGRFFKRPMTKEIITPLCSGECRNIYRLQEEREALERKELERKKLEEKPKNKLEDFIKENGMCGICMTPYPDCERMQTNFRMSPKGAYFENGKIIRCPKFTKPKKF